jgi:hypothetical protein
MKTISSLSHTIIKCADFDLHAVNFNLIWRVEPTDLKGGEMQISRFRTKVLNGLA